MWVQVKTWSDGHQITSQGLESGCEWAKQVVFKESRETGRLRQRKVLGLSQRGQPAPADCCQVVLNCEKCPSLKILDLNCLRVKFNTPASCIYLWVTSLYPWSTGRHTLTTESLSGLTERALKCLTPAEIPALSPKDWVSLSKLFFFFSFFPHLYF